MDDITSSLDNLSLQQPDNKYVNICNPKLCCQVISAHEGDEKDFDNLQYIAPRKYHFFFGNLSNIACVNSHVDCLAYAVKNGFPFERKALLYCAQSGSEQCFVYCLQNGIEYYSDVSLWAIEHGQHNFIDFLFQNDFVLHPDSLKKAFICNRIDMMNRLFDTGMFPINDELVEMASQSNNQDFKLFVYCNLDPTNVHKNKMDSLAEQVQNLMKF